MLKKGNKAVHTEIERKFTRTQSNQLGVGPVDERDALFDKIQHIFRLLDISFVDPKEHEKKYIDVYYDDSKHTISAKDCYVRKRSVELFQSSRYRLQKERIITLKARIHKNNGLLKRKECELHMPERDASAFVESATRIRDQFRNDIGITFANLGEISPIMKVINCRSKMSFDTKSGSYEFCFDKFYFEHEKKHSEFFYEIEIDAHDDDTALKDEHLDQFIEAMTNILEYKPDLQSKLERGLEWLDAEDNIDSICSIMMDIVGYSARTGESQKQLIQNFNRLVKISMFDIFPESKISEIIYLPTGDGMIIVFPAISKDIIDLVFSIQANVDKYNRDKPSEEHILFRTGVHAGPVFRYSDVKEQLNVAGSGINMAQRVGNIGDSGHILATSDAFTFIGNAFKATKKYFHYIGEATIKHGEKITVYNLYSDDHDAGNKSTPDGIETTK